MKFQRIVTLLLIGFTITLNALISANGIFGTQLNELSEAYSTVATPANYAFSIWSVIYLGLIAFGIWQVQKNTDQLPDIQSIRMFLWVNLVVNMAWLVLFHAELLFVGLIVMFVLLATNMFILHKMYTTAAYPAWVVFVFEIYLGWVCVATLIHLLIVINYPFGVSLSQDIAIWWLLLPLVILAMISTGIHQVKNKCSLFSVTIIWALIAIHVKHKANGLPYTFVPLLPLLIIIPDLVVQLISDARRYFNVTNG